MIRRLFFILGIFSFFDISCAPEEKGLLHRIGKAFKAEADSLEQKNKKPVVAESVKSPGIVGTALYVPMAISGALVQCATGSCAKVVDFKNRWCVWPKLDRPTAVDVASYSLVPWYMHAAHGYYQRKVNFNNDDIVQYSTMYQRLKASDFETFNKWHPIQSLKGTQRMWLPIIGPMVAAHATGLAYHAVVEHTPRVWYRNKIKNAEKK